MKRLVMPLLFALAIAGGCKCEDTTRVEPEHSSDESGSGATLPPQAVAPAPGEPGVAIRTPSGQSVPMFAQPSPRKAEEYQRKLQFRPKLELMPVQSADGGAADAH